MKPGEANMTDPHLVARAQQGDLPAFEELVRRYQREIYGLACRLALDPEEAKDLTQQAFLQAFLHIRDFRQQSQFRTWLFRIAINQCYNFLKNKRKFGEPVDTQEMQLIGENSPEEDLVAEQNRQRLYEALERLPAKQRAVITLKLEQGLDYKEISQVLGGTAGAARVNYCQALKTLKKYLLKDEDKHEVAVRSYPKMAARLPRR
jgi:RNA polymerase sigma-70 factor (ECF subfamily)